MGLVGFAGLATTYGSATSDFDWVLFLVQVLAIGMKFLRTKNLMSD